MESVLIGRRNAISNWGRQFRTIIDFDKNTYKLQETLFGFFKWGSYKPLPKPDYVLLFKNVFLKCETCSVDEYDNYPHAYIQVSLVYDKKRRIVVHETKNPEEAFNYAKKLATNLDLKIRDAFTDKRNPKWLLV